MDEPIEEHFVSVETNPNYEISNYGRVVNINTGKDLKPINVHGYFMVNLWDEGKRTVWYIHRLVAQAFFLNYREGYAVRHINGEHGDNTILNLTLTDLKVRKRENL